MDNTVQTFLKSHRVSVLGVGQEDGKVHSATLHCAHLVDPLSFFFMTEKDSKKCVSLLDGKETYASLVVGFSEEDFVTFQAEGNVVIVTEERQHVSYVEAYMHKYPSRTERKNNPNNVLLQFTPSWWRYRDYKSKPFLEINSDTK